MTEDLEPSTIIQLLPAEPGWQVYIQQFVGGTRMVHQYHRVVAWALVEYERYEHRAVEPVFYADKKLTSIAEHLRTLYDDTPDSYIVTWELYREDGI